MTVLFSAVPKRTQFVCAGDLIGNLIGMHRSAQELQAEGQLAAFTGTLWRFPLVYLIIFIVRFLLICLFRPLFRLSRQDLPFMEIAFATVAGLRGSVSLILTQAVVVDPSTRSGGPEVTVRQLFHIDIIFNEPP